MSRRAWLTPDIAPETRQCWRVFVPDNEEMRAAFRGALHLLSLSYNWEQYGAASAEDCAQVWEDANYETFKMERCSTGGGTMHVGAIFWYPSEIPPSGCLVCDGSLYDANDYPALFGVLGLGWGGSGSDFAVPDLRRSFIRGIGTDIAMGDTGGADSVTLGISEIPPHRHTIGGLGATFQTNETVGTAVFKTAGTKTTGLTGGGNPHENLPPFTALVPMIQAE